MSKFLRIPRSEKININAKNGKKIIKIMKVSSKKVTENAISEEQLKGIANLINETVLADKNNAIIQLQNYYTVYLSLEKEGNKKVYAENVKKICEISHITENTWAKKRSLFNQATKLKINISNIPSEAKLQAEVKAVKTGSKKVLKNGKVKTDVAGTAKIQEEKIQIQAVNDNEIVELMAATWFKNAMADIEKSGVSKATFMKAWAKSQVK